ncbi:MAG: divalent-cation tolerance protein CutA [Chloroflexi bacterium]|nr:divalent-cation tolerance protein CutA [Chloroflexota bacterium]
MSYIQVIVTGPRADIDKIAKELVERKLAACVQVAGPIQSTYWWEGAVERAEEWMGVVKTRQELYGEVEKTVRRLHSYQTPEILAMPVAGGNPDYLAWLDGSVRRLEGS